MFYVKKVIFLGLGNTHTLPHTTDTQADTLIHSLCPQTCSLSVDSHGYFWPGVLGFCLESAVLSCFAWFLQHCSREGAGSGECSVPGCVARWWSLERNLPQGEQAATSLLSLGLGASGLAVYREACLSRMASLQPLKIPGAGQVTMLSLFFQSG